MQETETAVSIRFGLEQRNERGQMLVDFPPELILQRK